MIDSYYKHLAFWRERGYSVANNQVNRLYGGSALWTDTNTSSDSLNSDPQGSSSGDHLASENVLRVLPEPLPDWGASQSPVKKDKLGIISESLDRRLARLTLL